MIQKDIVTRINSKKYIFLLYLLILIFLGILFFKSINYCCPSTLSGESKVKLPEPYIFTARCSSDDFLKNSKYNLDKNGILMVDYGNAYNKIGRIYNPLFICVYANILYREFLNGNLENKEKFIHQVNWLVDNCVECDGMAVWEYLFDNDKFYAKSPWISGLTQGVALSVLTRAYALTNNKKYSEIAEKAFKVFLVDMEKGGVRTIISEESFFYEEVARNDIPSSKVLNGHIGALVGLGDYFQYSQNLQVKKAFDNGVKALKEELDKYDAKGTSYYSLSPKILAPRGGYNIQHVHQLLWVYMVTGDPYFLQYALKFYYYEQKQYTVKVKGSTDPKGHGKNNLYLQFGNHYWSHNQFPTWIELDLMKPRFINEFIIFSGGLKEAFPKDYDISFSLDGERWYHAIKIRNSYSKINSHKVDNIYARFIKLDILNDNGNKNVVLTGFGIEVSKNSRDPVALTDFDHFSSGNPPLKLIDNDMSTTWINHDGKGWIIIDLNEIKSLEKINILSKIKDTTEVLKFFNLYISTNMIDWQEITKVLTYDISNVQISITDKMLKARYVKLEFEQTESFNINEIYINEKEKYATNYICELFNELNNKVNNGKGYSEYLNVDGFPTGALLAWSESYLMEGYANMYRATGDVKWLDTLNEHIKSVLSNRDDKIGQKDYKGELVPCWGTDRYTKNREWMHFAAHTGMITYPILEFVQLVRESGIEKYYDSARIFLQQVEESIEYHDKDWRIDHYVFPEDFYKNDYIIPISQQAAMGRSLVLIYKLTNKEEYLIKAKNLAKFIKDKSIIENNKGGYILKNAFIPGKNIPEDKIVDISHATVTIHFAYLAYKNNIVFDNKDMHKFARTIKQLAVNNNNRFPKFLDGTGNFDYEVTAGQYAFLSEFDEEIYTSIIDLFFNHLKIDKTAKYMQEDWWGTIMLGLSRLALFENTFE